MIIKKIDFLGRFCIPAKTRKSWGINELSVLQLFADKNGLHIKNRKENKGTGETYFYYERAIDPMGRLTIPHELRNRLNIECDSYLEVSIEEDSIYIHAPRKCAICGNNEHLKPYMDKYICTECLDKCNGCLDEIKAEMGL